MVYLLITPGLIALFVRRLHCWNYHHFMEVFMSLRLLSLEMNSSSRVQLLHVAICISLADSTFEKDFLKCLLSGGVE